MVCPRCGANNDNNEQFCYNCGLKLEGSGQGQPQGAPGVPPPPTAPPAPYGQGSGYGSPPPYGQQPPAYGQQPPAYGGYQQPYGAPQYPQMQPNSTAAIVSLIAGIVSWLAFPVISAIVAVIAGHMARGEIRRSNGALGGGGMALAGLILGYLNILIVVGVFCFIIFFAVIAGSTSTSP